MSSWLEIKPGLIELIKDISSLQTLWMDKKRPFVDPTWQAAILLHIRGAREVGHAERRWQDLGLSIPEPTLRETRVGYLIIRLDIRVESYRHEDDRFAFSTALKIREQLPFIQNRQRLTELNLAIIQLGEALDIGEIYIDDRVMSVGVVELQLSAAIIAVNEDSAGQDNRMFNVEQVNNPIDHPNTVFEGLKVP